LFVTETKRTPGFIKTKCEHKELSHATSEDWETVCADCGAVIDGTP
jgi:hypothetical protein